MVVIEYHMRIEVTDCRQACTLTMIAMLCAMRGTLVDFVDRSQWYNEMRV